MTETPLFFPTGRYSLFGVLHEPEGSLLRSPFVFCHPFGEEKLWAHRVFVSFARRLAREGHAVLRFDYMGNGDSDGDFRESSLASARFDVQRAIDHLRQATGAPAVGLVGLRWGATVASLVAEERPDVDRLILWAPILDGARYMQDLLRNNLTTQVATYKEVRQDRAELVAAMAQGQSVNVDGYEMTFPMYSEVSAINLASVPVRYEGRCLVVQIASQPGRAAPDLQQFSSGYPHSTTAFAQEEPFWKEILRWYSSAPNLFEVTVDWIKASAGADAGARRESQPA